MKGKQSVSIVMVPNDAKRAREEVTCDDGHFQIDKKRKIEQITDEKITGYHQEEEIIDAATDDNDNGPLELDDINNDCLRHIFEFLTLHELIKVADIGVRFIFPAAEAFSRCYRKKKIEVVATSQPILNFTRFGFLQLAGAAAMNGLTHFGARMKIISANFDAFELTEEEHRDPIDVAILKNCYNSLTDFEVHFCIERHFQTITKPFAEVQNLTLNGCMLGEKFAQLNVWFPNVVALKLAGIWVSQPTVIETAFVHLTNLSIINDADTKIPTQTIQHMLRLNGQLQALQLRCNYGVEMLQTIADELRQLEVLELSTPDDCFASFGADQKFTFTMVRIFTLHASQYADYVVKMPFLLAKVDELRLYGFDQFHSLVVALILSGDQLSTITLLPFQVQWTRSNDDFDALKWALQTRRYLNELELCTDEFEGDDLAHLIGACKQLKHVRLMSLKSNGFHTTGLEHNWTVCEHGMKVHSVNMENDDFGFRFQLFYQVYMIRNYLK